MQAAPHGHHCISQISMHQRQRCSCQTLISLNSDFPFFLFLLTSPAVCCASPNVRLEAESSPSCRPNLISLDSPSVVKLTCVVFCQINGSTTSKSFLNSEVWGLPRVRLQNSKSRSSSVTFSRRLVNSAGQWAADTSADAVILHLHTGRQHFPQLQTPYR